MPRNIGDLMDGTRTRLGDPRAQHPGDAQILQQVTTQIRTLLRAKRNVSNPWNYGETVIDTVFGEDTYQIQDATFGTPLAVVTYDPLNPNHIQRLIPFSCPQNLTFSWGWPENAGQFFFPPDGSNCNAARCSIYWQNTKAFIRFLPTPQIGPAQYQIKFLMSANMVGSQALTASPLPDEDMDLIEIRAALGLLAFTEWDAPTTKEQRTSNAERRKDAFVTLGSDEKRAYEQFSIANRITTGPRLNVRWSSCTE